MTSSTLENPLALDNQVCFALAIASRNVIALYRPILEPLGLTHPQYLVMLALWDESPRTLKGLGRALCLEPATLSPLLKRLETTGYVRRQRRLSDERALDITLTERGTALRAVAETIPPRVVEALNLPLDDLAALRESLHAVIAATSAH
ncbi:MAG: MarR family transcriptional regulator [Cryobacterium sp.]|uniref:MarR family winged helix-turn-helix transcriptional regulator n=1 Tax=unclassified Cryobacterium TaxID=2649013 RepID=UPI0018C975F1|nr:MULTISPECIES: MarR family transcriptional regulator [unclassified Cryobacterium]MCY7403388.1 MarR family transcriptional regulator [Cryobacterium sp.]MEC5153445.1 DNA-binding MarR family transcriptional regulator [Cryobacterium sp. CAN_C3]